MSYQKLNIAYQNTLREIDHRMKELEKSKKTKNRFEKFKYDVRMLMIEQRMRELKYLKEKINNFKS